MVQDAYKIPARSRASSLELDPVPDVFLDQDGKELYPIELMLISQIIPFMFITAKHNFLHTENGKTKLNKTTAKNRLNLKLDEDGIIRCYGRMTNTNLPQETITPILLPRKEKFIELMIEEYHERLLHAGVSHTFLKSGQNIGLYMEESKSETF